MGSRPAAVFVAAWVVVVAAAARADDGGIPTAPSPAGHPFAMAQTVFTFNLASDGRQVLADRIEVAARWVYPAVFFSVLWRITSRL